MPDQAGHDMAQIGDRDQATETLIGSELRYRRLFETAQDGILILDADTGLIVDVNPFLIEMLGFSHDAFVGKRNLGTRMLQGHRRQPGQLLGIAAETVHPLRRHAIGNRRWAADRRGVRQQRLSGGRPEGDPVQHPQHHLAQAGGRRDRNPNHPFNHA